MKESQRRGEAYIKSLNFGWKSKEYEENYDRIFKKPHIFETKTKGIWQWEECKKCGISKTEGLIDMGLILPEYCKGRK